MHARVLTEGNAVDDATWDAAGAMNTTDIIVRGNTINNSADGVHVSPMSARTVSRPPVQVGPNPVSGAGITDNQVTVAVPRWSRICMERFPHAPREAVFKEDRLRGGVAFDPSALSDNESGEVKPKSYFIFSFDHGTLPELGEAALRRPPEEIILTGGPYDLRRTVVSVRVNPSSPYRVAANEEGVLGLYLDGRRIADVGVPPMPEYYRHTLSNGKSVMEVAPTIQWGYLIYLTVFRVCQYFGAKEECQYCDINHNWRQHKAAGRPYTGVKDVEEVLEALEIIDRYDTAKASTAYTLTGGAITKTVSGRDEADFYGHYAKAIEERFPGRWIGKVVAQALPKDDVQRFKDYGVQIYHPNQWRRLPATVTVTTRDPLDSWRVGFSFPGGQRIRQTWDATASQDGPRVTATAADYNEEVAAGGKLAFGFLASWRGTNSPPSGFTLNGRPCARA
ncbi:hypothetical protein SGRIM128S_02785 [Streptomyces griseomycini]